MPWLIAIRALGWLKSAWTALVGLVVNYPLQCALAASLCLSWGLYQRGERYRAKDLRDLAQIASLHAAGQAEHDRALAERAAAVKKQKDDDDATDRRVVVAGAPDLARLNAHIGWLRSQLAAARNVPASGGTDMAKSGDGQGGTSIVDEIADDDRICTVNTRRLLEIHNESVGTN